MQKWIVIGVVLLVVLLGIGSYNGLVSKSQAVDNQWAQVQNVYQRRADLIPNLVATVSGAANFEKSTMVQVTEARSGVDKVQDAAGQALNDPAKFAQYEQAQNALSSALSRFNVVVERYPDLKATANFQDLQAQLEGTENRITVERQRFNDVVQTYNTSIKKFPTMLFARTMGFTEKPYFAAVTGAEVPPKVQFDTPGTLTH